MSRSPLLRRRARRAAARVPSRLARRRDQRGAVVVEFALIVPMLLLLVFGVIEFSYMMNRDNVIDNASRDGARLASLDGSFADICTMVKSDLSGSGVPVPAACNSTATANAAVIKIDCLKVDGSACAATATTFDTLAVSGGTATVTVTFNYKWITPLVSSIFGSTMTLNQFTQMRIE